jgi:hypothetical protein
MSGRLVLPALVLGRIFLMGTTNPSEAQVCQNPKSQADATEILSAIRIVPGGTNFSVASGTSTALNAAIAQWNTACGSNVPTLSKTAPSPVTFTINYMMGTYNIDAQTIMCGATPLTTPGTVLGGGTITIFEQTRSGSIVLVFTRR